MLSLAGSDAPELELGDQRHRPLREAPGGEGRPGPDLRLHEDEHVLPDEPAGPGSPGAVARKREERNCTIRIRIGSTLRDDMNGAQQKPFAYKHSH